ncbi:MAG: hypothetical protein IJ395_02235 [Clostridia bacterium]|nr:hypothetical protein [Clostridia bacterium]
MASNNLASGTSVYNGFNDKLLMSVKRTLFQAIVNNRKELQITKNSILYCEFNIDIACVEAKLTDGLMVSVYCIAVENKYANNMY